VGQEKAPHHPEWEYHGRYSRGQESANSPRRPLSPRRS
jgi:hypothetical protein